jgi:hypothetical protein
VKAASGEASDTFSFEPRLCKSGRKSVSAIPQSPLISIIAAKIDAAILSAIDKSKG